MATRQLLGTLADAYERRSGIAVSIESVGGVEAAKRVASVEAFDFTVLASAAIEELIASGHVDGGTCVDIARSGMAVAVRSGAPRVDITTEAALRAAVLAATTIGYSTGPSGAHLARLLERWGIADTVAQRLRLAPPGVPVGTFIASGEVEIGFQQMSELMDVPGIDVLGALPPGAQAITVFRAAACTSPGRQDETRALFAYLASPETEAVKRRHGMEP